MTHLCDYGCGQKATYQFKNGKWCCKNNISYCPIIKQKISKTNIGHYVSNDTKNKLRKLNKGKSLSNDTKQKISIANTGKVISIETRLKIGLTISKIEKKYPLFSKIEAMRYNPDIPNEIQTHCKNHNCPNSKEKGGWFTPTKLQLQSRIYSIEKDNRDVSYIYCSEKCKEDCPLFNKKITQIIKEDQIKAGIIKEEYYTTSEYSIWREEVLKRANYKCEYCEEKAVHVHHIKPQKLEPFFSLDPDFGIACCEKCHYEKGHKDECSTGQLASQLCI